MILKIRTPGPPLGAFVESFIFHEGYRPEHSKERLLPDGSVDLIIDLTKTPKHVYNNNDFRKKTAYRRGWVSGIRTRYITIDAGLDSSMIVVRFLPGGAWPFFGFALNDLSDLVVEADHIWGNDFVSLREQLLNTREVYRRFDMIEAFLLRQAGDRLLRNKIVDFGIKQISSRPEAGSIRMLSKDIGHSQKHLAHVFKWFVGVSPKQFSRISRFQRVVHVLENRPPESWSGLACQNGFYDQAHLINEFKEFAGTSPASYLVEKGSFPNYMPID